MVLGTPLARNHWLFNAEEEKAHNARPRPHRAADAREPVMLDFAGKRWWYL